MENRILTKEEALNALQNFNTIQSQTPMLEEPRIAIKNQIQGLYNLVIDYYGDRPDEPEFEPEK